MKTGSHISSILSTCPYFWIFVHKTNVRFYLCWHLSYSDVKKEKEKYRDIGTGMIKEKFGEQVTMSRGDELLWTSCIPGKKILPLLTKLHRSVLTHLFIQKQWGSCPSIRNYFSHKFSLDFRLINIPKDLVGFRADIKIWSHLLQKRLCWIKSVFDQKSRGFVVATILFRLMNSTWHTILWKKSATVEYST